MTNIIPFQRPPALSMVRRTAVNTAAETLTIVSLGFFLAAGLIVMCSVPFYWAAGFAEAGSAYLRPYLKGK